MTQPRTVLLQLLVDTLTVCGICGTAATNLLLDNLEAARVTDR